MAKFDVENFYQAGNLYLIPPYIHEDIQAELKAYWDSLELTEHVFILSSGTSSKGAIKSYAISKGAIIANAVAVNGFLGTNSSSAWLSSLPYFHIGGLSIFVRAHESNSSLIQDEGSWDPSKFNKMLETNKINFTSLVPTQLYDLVKNKYKAPNNLLGVFIGGDFLNSTLRNLALGLGWPLIETYGMTETSSQIASSFSQKMIDGYLELLPIHSLIKHNNNDGEYKINSSSLFTLEMILDQGIWSTLYAGEGFLIKDHMDLILRENKSFLKPLGRWDEQIKIKGRLYNFLELKDIAHKIFFELGVYSKMELVLEDDNREGKILTLWYEKRAVDTLQRVEELLSDRFPLVLKITNTVEFPQLPKNIMGKLIKP